VSLLVKAEYLLASSDFLTPDASITLSYPAKVLRKGVSRELSHIESTRQVSRILRWVLPELEFSRMLDSDGQPFLLVIKKQLGVEIFRLDMLVGVSLFSLLLILLLYMRRRFVLEREHSRDMLFQHREQAEITLHSIADAVITTDAEGRVEHMNATAERITGWSLAAARGRELSKVLPLRDEHTQAVVLNPVAECIREGRTVRLSEAVILHDRQGGESLIMANASPIRDRDPVMMPLPVCSIGVSSSAGSMPPCTVPRHRGVSMPCVIWIWISSRWSMMPVAMPRVMNCWCNSRHY